MKIIYLVGLAHSGSTYLSRILNQHADVFAAGELLYLHDFLDELSGHCKCGRKADECPFWSEVHRRLKDQGFPLDRTSRVSLDRRVEWMKALMGRQRPGYLDDFGKLNRSLFELLAEQTSCPVILDSSKTLWRGLPLYTEIPDLKVLHLIKSPKNQLASRRKRGYSFWHSALLKYARKNWLATRFFQHPKRYLKVKFERFVNDPERELRRIYNWLDLPYEDPFSKPSELWHHMRGSWGELERPNPERLEHEKSFSPLQQWMFGALERLY